MVTVTLYARHGAEHIRPCQLDCSKTERDIEVDDIIVIINPLVNCLDGHYVLYYIIYIIAAYFAISISVNVPH